MKYGVAIHWFRNGLRVHDNPSLVAACSESQFLLPLFVIDPKAPFAQTTGRRAGIIRANFVLESLRTLDGKLRKMGSQLVVVVGDPKEVLPDVVLMSKANALFYEKDVAAPIRDTDREVRSTIREQNMRKDVENCQIRDFDTHTLFPIDMYMEKCREQVAPSTFGGFQKIFEDAAVSKEKEDVSKFPPLLSEEVLSLLRSKYGGSLDIPTLVELGYDNVDESLAKRGKGGIEFHGGEDAGLDLLKTMMQRTQWVATFEKPNTSPNALTVDTTGLSPYVKHGCISIRRFYHALGELYKKNKKSDLSKPPVSLLGQLMWREYNYLMGYSTPNFDKMVANPIARQIPWGNDPELLDAWRNSRTGYPFIDAIMTQLRETGWIHHLARHAVACFLTRGDLWQSWEKGAEVFEELLIDADWSINNFNWQWLSCTAHFYQYFRCYSPVSFGKKTDPNGDYIRKWLPQFKSMPKAYICSPWEAPLHVQKQCGVIIGENYPMPIVDHTTVSKANMSRMKEAYDAQEERRPAPPSRSGNYEPSPKRHKTR